MFTHENLQESLKQFDKEIEKREEAKRISEALQRLKENDDWKLVVEKAYIEEESKRILDGVMNTQNMLKRENLQNMLDMLMAVRYFKQFIEILEINGVNADEQIDQIKLQKAEFAKDYEEKIREQMEEETNPSNVLVE